MWKPRLPRGNSDALTAVGLVVGLPTVFMLTQGAPVIETVATSGVIAAVLLVIYR